MGYVSNPGAVGGGGSSTLAEDAYAEADPITDYSSGIFVMPVSAVAGWDGNGVAGSVITVHTLVGGEHFGRQEINWNGGDNFAWREWENFGGTPDWGVWNYVPKAIGLPRNSFTESAIPSDFSLRFSVMPTTAGANWGPNAGEVGEVHTTYDPTTGNGYQTFYAVNGNIYRRVYTSSAWGAWGTFTIT